MGSSTLMSGFTTCPCLGSSISDYGNTSLPHDWAWEYGVLTRLLHLNQPQDRDASAPTQIQVYIYCLWSMSTASELVSLHLLPVISNPMKRFGQLPAAYGENHHHHLPFKVLNKEPPTPF